jgi:hypothetical protein
MPVFVIAIADFGLTLGRRIHRPSRCFAALFAFALLRVEA